MVLRGFLDSVSRTFRSTEHSSGMEGTTMTSTNEEDATPVTSLIAVSFTDPLLAQEASIAMIRLERRQSLKIDDMAIVSKTTDGRVHIHQTRDMSAGQGAATGGMWGALVGLAVAAPFIGAAIGAAAGGLFAKLRDIGIDDVQMRDLGDSLADGQAALFVLLEDFQIAHLLAELRRFDGRLLHTTVDPEIEAQLQEALAYEI